MIIAKYILIKSYPGRNINDVALYDPLICLDNFIWEKDGKPIPSDFQPDISPWFRLVSNFTILSFCDKEKKVIWTKEGDSDNYNANKNTYGSRFTYKDLTEGYGGNLKDGEIIIHSIQRHKDNEIFTLGDRVGSYSYIKSILLEKDNYQTPWLDLCTKEGGDTGGTSFWIANLFQNEKPFLVTEDGEEIFKGDKFYTTYEKGQILNTPLECNAHIGFSKDVWTGLYKKEKNAKRHIYSILSKKLFSYNDIQSLFDFNRGGGNEQLLKDFIKSNIS